MIKFSKLNEGLNKKIKIGLDFHGVVDSLPEFFSFLTDSFIKNNGEVHIITGGHIDDDFKRKLESMNIKYSHIFSVYDFLIDGDFKTTGEVKFPDGTIQKKFENSDWDHVKSNYCRDNDISLHIDDTLIYNDFFTTPFARLWSHNNNPKSSHKDVRLID